MERGRRTSAIARLFPAIVFICLSAAAGDQHSRSIALRSGTSGLRIDSIPSSAVFNNTYFTFLHGASGDNDAVKQTIMYSLSGRINSNITSGDET